MPKTLDDSISSLKASGKALLDALSVSGSPAYLASREAFKTLDAMADAPPILAPQSCKICGKDSQSQVCSSTDCQAEFYSSEYQEWPEDEEADYQDEEEY